MNTISPAVIATSPKIGAWKGAWHLMRASWSTLKISPEVISLQALSFIVSLVTTAIIGLGIWSISGIRSFTALEHWLNSTASTDVSWLWLIPALLYWVLTLSIGNFFSAAIVSAVLERFAGNKPTVNSSLIEARKKIVPILQYSTFMATIAMIFQVIHQVVDESRLPFVGKLLSRLTASLAEFSLNLISVFTIPVIMVSQNILNPIQAIKGSSNLFKKVWGQELTGGISLSLIYTLALIPTFGLSFLAGILGIVNGAKTLLITVPIVIAWIVISMTVIGTLNIIFHVALFRFATTGESPAQFDKNLLKAAFRPRRKWFV